MHFRIRFRACIPCVFLLSTVLGALCLLVTSIIYLRAAIASEKWIACDKIVVKKDDGKSIKRLRPPSMAPPRMKKASTAAAVNDGVDVDGDGHQYGNVLRDNRV